MMPKLAGRCRISEIQGRAARALLCPTIPGRRGRRSNCCVRDLLSIKPEIITVTPTEVRARQGSGIMGFFGPSTATRCGVGRRIGSRRGVRLGCCAVPGTNIRNRRPRAGGDPVRCGFSVQSLLPLEYWIPACAGDDNWLGDDLTPDMCVRDLAAHCARGFRFIATPEIEGAGKTGCAPHPRSRVQLRIETRTRAYRFGGSIPAFPAQWLYGLLVLSPVNGSFATVAAWIPPRNLTPAPRRQDHTTSPYA